MNTFRNALTVVVFAILLYFPVFAVCFRSAAAWFTIPMSGGTCGRPNGSRPTAAVPQFDSFSSANPAEPLRLKTKTSSRSRQRPSAKPAVTSEPGRPWVDYSWAAELVLGGFHKALGLRGLVVYSALLALSIVLAFHVLVRRMQPNLLVSAVLTLAASVGIMGLTTPRPWLFSMLFFVIELNLLLEAGRTARPRLLLLLVPLFWLWANIHIQFTLGLLVLAAAVVEPLLARRLLRGGSRCCSTANRPLSRRVGCSWCLCSAAAPRSLTLTTCGSTPRPCSCWASRPYGMSSRNWRRCRSARLPIGRCWRRRWPARRRSPRGGRVRLLLVLLFPLALYCSFRSRRDVWLVLVVGLALAASMSRGLPFAPTRLTIRGRWGVAGILAALVMGSLLSLNEARLQKQVAEGFPAKAVAFLKQGSYEGPLYNTYNWGGYLIYRLSRSIR